jgi:hydrogenase expression/formation protein HypE
MPAPKNRSSLGRALDLKQGRIDLAHGSGGRAMAQLIEELFARHLDNPFLAQGDDGAVLPGADGRLVMATDSHVISPLFFPGGDIGSLSVHGTLNDLAVMGARPLWLSAAFILEEGFPLADLARIVESMGEAAVRPASPSSPATPRLSSAARVTACSSPPPASAACPPAATCRVGMPARGTWC